MKSKWIWFLLIIPFIFSCKKDSEIKEEVAEIPVAFTIDRFDKAFYETPVEQFQSLKVKYPYFFPAGIPDTLWTNRIQHPLYRELYQEVQKQFPNNQFLETELSTLFKHIKFYFPKLKTPKVNTLISEMDYESKAIYTDSLVIVSIDMYLGKNHRFYEFPEYIKQNFEPAQIVQDVAADFYLKKSKKPSDKSFLAQMVYEGKGLYLKELLIPKSTDAERIGYTNEQMAWCLENEIYMWEYFVERKMLYDTDNNLLRRFIYPAPFSKFYLEFDNETPGKVGAWIGWQIVRSYMKNNEVTLQKMLEMDEKELFLQSKYKPKK